MPKPEEIIIGLQTIVDENSLVAILWHLVFYLSLIAMVLKWRPSKRLVAILFCLPLLSVSIMAWLTGNPFNGLLFILFAILIFIFAFKTTTLPVQSAAIPFRIIGICMIIFGLIYPHFMQGHSVFSLFYESPAGLIPCPTLSVLIGIVLFFNGISSKWITLVFCIAGSFYGIFGVFRLGVTLDVFLIAGSAVLWIQYFLMSRNPI